MDSKRFDIVDPGNARGAYPAEIRGEYVRIMVDCAENFGEPLPIAQKIADALNGDEASYAWHPSTAQTSQHPTQAVRYEVYGTREAIDAFQKRLEGHDGMAETLERIARQGCATRDEEPCSCPQRMASAALAKAGR